MGSWALGNRTQLHTLRDCTRACRCCAACRFVSYSDHPKHRECSWYSHCNPTLTLTITLPLHRHRSPLTAHRSPLTTHLSPITPTLTLTLTLTLTRGTAGSDYDLLLGQLPK